MSHSEQKAPFGQAESSTVQFKGRPGAFELRLDPDAGLMEILQDLKQSLAQNHALVHKRSIHLNFGKRPLDQLQFGEIRHMLTPHLAEVTSLEVELEGLQEFLEGEFGVPVNIRLPKGPTPAPQSIPTKPPETVEAATTPSVSPVPETTVSAPPPSAQTAVPRPVAVPPMQAPPIQAPPRQATPQPTRPDRDNAPQPITMAHQARATSQGDSDRQTKPIHKIMRTCRAGMSVDFDGDIFVFGDVNPGAELRATGDIIVFGSLRGIAHAGSLGNPKAMIVAFDLNPTQIRLGGQIAIAPPSDHKRARVRPEAEVAYLNENQQIQVETYQGRMPVHLAKLKHV